MPLLKPIPPALLPHSMTVAVPDPDAAYGGEYLDPVEVAGVRYEGATGLETNGYRLAEGAAGRVWMDAENTDGAFDVPVGSKVSLLGHEFACASCRAYEGPSGKVHHWEMDLR